MSRLAEELQAGSGGRHPPLSLGALTAQPRGPPALGQWVHVHVTTLDGATAAELSLPPSATGADVRAELQSMLGVAMREQQLVVGEQVLLNHHPLAQLLAAAEDSINVHITLVKTPPVKLGAITGHPNGSLLVRDFSQAEPVGRLSGHTGAVTCLAAHVASQRAASGGEDGTLRLWSLEGCEELRVMGGERGTRAPSITCLAVDWPSMQALAGYEDGNLCLWDLEYGEVFQKLVGHHLAINCLAWDPAANAALSGSQDRKLCLWDVEAGETVNELFGHLTSVTCLTANFRREVAVSGSMAIVRVWQNIYSSYHHYYDLLGHADIITCVALDPLGGAIAAGAGNGILRQWGADKAADGPARQHGGAPVWCLQALWDSRRVVTGCEDGCLRVWDSRGEVERQLPSEADGSVVCLALFGLDVGTSGAEDSPGGVVLLIIPSDKGTQVCRVYGAPRDAYGGVRPTVREMRQQLKEAHSLLYVDKLRFRRDGSATILGDADKLPAPPARVQVEGPGSVVQMLSLALCKAGTRME